MRLSAMHFCENCGQLQLWKSVDLWNRPPNWSKSRVEGRKSRRINTKLVGPIGLITQRSASSGAVNLGPIRVRSGSDKPSKEFP
jgi:hypothetical protein